MQLPAESLDNLPFHLQHLKHRYPLRISADAGESVNACVSARESYPNLRKNPLVKLSFEIRSKYRRYDLGSNHSLRNHSMQKVKLYNSCVNNDELYIYLLDYEYTWMELKKTAIKTLISKSENNAIIIRYSPEVGDVGDVGSDLGKM